MTDTSSTAGQGAADQGAADAAAAQAAATAAQAGAQQTASAAPAQTGNVDTVVADLDWTNVPAPIRAAFEAERERNARLQRENGSERAGTKAAAREDGMKAAALALARAMGADIPDDSAVTIEGVQSTLKDTVSERDALRTEAAITSAAYLNDVLPAQRDLVEFKLSKSAEFRALDTTAADYADKVSAAVAALVAADSSLKRPVGVQAAGVESHGGANGNDAITPEQFKAMSVGQQTDLYRTNFDAWARLSGTTA